PSHSARPAPPERTSAHTHKLRADRNCGRPHNPARRQACGVWIRTRHVTDFRPFRAKRKWVLAQRKQAAGDKAGNTSYYFTASEIQLHLEFQSHGGPLPIA